MGVFMKVLQQQGKAQPFLSEGDGITMLPDVPATEKHEGRACRWGDDRGSGIELEQTHISIHRVPATERGPELTGDSAVEDDV
jgi:hypothetical protein